MVPANSLKISRVPSYSGVFFMCTNISSTRLSRSLAGLSKPFYYIYTHVSEDPITPCLPKQTRFGLFPVRSPLLRESLLFSLPMGTKMFQFPTFALSFESAGAPLRRVAPFGNLRIASYVPIPAAFRSLSRPSSLPRAKASTVCLLSISSPE